MPENGSTFHQLCNTASCPSLRRSCRKKTVWCREAGGLFTQLWCPRLVEEYSHLRWFHVTTAKHWMILEIEHLTKVGWKWGCQSFSCPCPQKCDCRWKEEICFTWLFRLRNLSLHFLPVGWCFWELVFCTVYHHPCMMETALQQKSCCLHYCHHVSFSPIASFVNRR